MLSIREIEIFRAVMQAGSISGAARVLKVAQPAVSKYVGQLERRLGHKLFQRKGNGIYPTAEARALFDQVERVFLSLDQVERFMQDLAQLRRGHVTFACMPLLSLTIAPHVIVEFLRDKPDVSISLQTRSSARIIEWVAARQVDFGIGINSGAHPEMDFDSVVDLELHCALPPGDPLEKRAEIGPEDLAGRDIITLSNYDRQQIAIDALLDRKLIKPRRRIEVFWTSVALDLAMRGAGIAFVDRLSASSVSGGLERLRPFRPRLSMDIGIFWPRHWQPPAASIGLAQMLKQEIQRRVT